MSIVRIGLSESKNYAEGYDRIFGKKQADAATKEKKAPAASEAEKKPADKKKKK